MSRRDDAMSAEDHDWTSHHERCEEYDDCRRHARQEGYGTEGVAAVTEERTGGLWDDLAASIARARR